MTKEGTNWGRTEAVKFMDIMAAGQKVRDQSLYNRLFPDDDLILPSGDIIYARDRYQKNLEFFRVGATYRERCAMAANRVGKTFGMGGYEIAAHLTGLYPHWWEGRRFKAPVRAWAAGETNDTTRDVVQATLMGEVIGSGPSKGFSGTGVVLGKKLGKITWKQGVNDLADTVKVRHISGGWSVLGFKSYQQGRKSFEGTAQHVIWLDEEPPIEVYGECISRTATTNGIIMLTFTPLAGLSETVMQFMPQEMRLDA